MWGGLAEVAKVDSGASILRPIESLRKVGNFPRNENKIHVPFYNYRLLNEYSVLGPSCLVGI